MSIEERGSFKEFVDGYDAVLPEQGKPLVVAESDLSSALEKYQEILGFSLYYVNKDYGVNAVLSPEEIHLFLKTAHKIHKRNYFHTQRLALFTSRLIQNSYERGSTHFNLQLQEIPPLYGVGMYIHGTADLPVIISVTGKVGWNFGCSSEFCEFTLEGDSSSQIGYCAKNCTFKTANKKTLELFLNHEKQLSGAGNKIIFIHGQGVEELIKR